MDFSLLQSVVDELARLLPGARIERVYEGMNRGVYLVFHRHRNHYTVLLSPDRSLPRIHLVAERPPASGTPSGFTQLLRSRLTGSFVTSVTLLNDDRIVDCRFVRDTTDCRVIFEVFGSRPNLIATDGSSTILAVFHPAPLSEAPKRLLVQGLRYQPPEQRPRPNRRVAAGHISLPEPDAEYPANRGAELYYDGLMAEQETSLLRQRLSSTIKRALEKARRKAAALTADLASAEQAEQYRLMGEMILANRNRLAKGMSTADLVGYDGLTRTVALDPERPPSANAERYFKKYKKAKAGRALIAGLLHTAREEENRLHALRERLDQAADGDALHGIRSELVKAGYPADENTARKGGSPLPPAPLFREILFQGWKLLVGKSAAGNDYLTTKLARPDDLWLHAEGMPGSHVLIANPGRREVPPEVLRKAAAIAAYYSKGRGAGKVPVTYTSARNVRKPKGAKPGLVTLSERTTIMAAPEEH